jgi:hypothetical protein
VGIGVTVGDQTMSKLALSILVMLAVGIHPGATGAQPKPSAAEARAVAKEAYIYGYPMVDNYRILYAYFVDRQNKEFKGPWNQLVNIPRVYTPEDKAVQTPNSDTPYSFVGMDLRAEPIVLTVPAIEKRRYYSIQLIDLFTHNFAYIGSRATGNDAGRFLVAGPRWKGEAPKDIKKVFRSETDLVLAGYRTQLIDPADLDNVKRIQAGYKAEPLSMFLGKPAPRAAPAVNWVRPLSPPDQRTSLEFFNVMSFLLQFTAPHPSEKALRARFAKIGIEAGKPFEVAKLAPEMKAAIEGGMADGQKAFEEFKRTHLDTGKVTAGDLFGTRAYLKNDYMARMAGAIMGIYGNSKEEAMYPVYTLDAAGKPLEGANRYTLRFAGGELPPVQAFWSLTMYELPSSLLVANPINRYLINSPMVPGVKRDADGGMTLYIQSESPGKDKEANWLPAPSGRFWMSMRLYWPKDEALEGKWAAPKLLTAK